MTGKKFTDKELDRKQFENIHIHVKGAIIATRSLRGNYLFAKELQEILESAEKLVK